MAKVYVKIDEKKRVTAVFSSIFLRNTEDWIMIAEGYGDNFVHISSDFFGKSIYEEHFVPRYKYENGNVFERSAEEIAADIPTTVYTSAPSTQELTDALSNVYYSMFDGLKLVGDRTNPLHITLPFPIKPNMFYEFDGKLYVGMKDGIATAATFDDYFAADEI